jgi:hypothetical protein
MQFELSEHIAPVRLHGKQANMQAFGNSLTAISFGD